MFFFLLAGSGLFLFLFLFWQVLLDDAGEN